MAGFINSSDFCTHSLLRSESCEFAEDLDSLVSIIVRSRAFFDSASAGCRAALFRASIVRLLIRCSNCFSAF